MDIIKIIDDNIPRPLADVMTSLESLFRMLGDNDWPLKDHGIGFFCVPYHAGSYY